MAATDLRGLGTAGGFITTATYPTTGEIADAVWAKALPGTYTTGQAGWLMDKIYLFILYIIGSAK